jgi:hypothetical protein
MRLPSQRTAPAQLLVLFEATMTAHVWTLVERMLVQAPEIGSRREIALSLGAAILLLPINAQVLLSDSVPWVLCPLPFPLVWLAFVPSWMIPRLFFTFGRVRVFVGL